MASPFAVCFIGQSYPVPAENFIQASPGRYVLDVVATVTPQYWTLKEVALFLTAPNILDASLGLGLYIHNGGSDWHYRGCVHAGHPSEAMPLSWPEAAQSSGMPGVAQIGVSLEPVAELIQKEGSKLGAREDFAKRVAYNLFRYIESFGGTYNNQLVVPMNVLDEWFKKFQSKFRLDPDFLTRQAMPP